MQEMQVRFLGPKIPWRRAWQPTPVFLPGEPHEQRRLAGYSPWGCKKLDMTEATEHACMASFVVVKLESLLTSHLFLFLFLLSLGDWSKKTLVRFMLENVLPMFSSRSFMVSHLMFKFFFCFCFCFLPGKSTGVYIHIFIYIFFFILFSIMVHHKLLNIVACAR